MKNDDSDPVLLPDPDICGAQLLRKKISFGPENSYRMVLQIGMNGLILEYGRILKESIYGQVNHAVGIHFESGIYTRTAKQFAIKTFQKAKLRKMNPRTQENPLTEIAIMQIIGDHENIVNFVCAAQDKDNLYSIMDFCEGGELLDFVLDNGPPSEADSKHYFFQIMKGLEYLERYFVAHRDMSLENVLLCEDGVCKIIDFGMALKIHDRSGVAIPIRSRGVCGKDFYISPEVMDDIHAFNPLLSDRWAVGIMLFILSSGLPPMHVATEADTNFKILKDKGVAGLLVDWFASPEDPFPWDPASRPELVDLLDRILRVDPEDRISISGILSHPWMTG